MTQTILAANNHAGNLTAYSLDFGVQNTPLSPFALSTLRKLEWGAVHPYTLKACCPCCHARMQRGHLAHCGLALLLQQEAPSLAQRLLASLVGPFRRPIPNN